MNKADQMILDAYRSSFLLQNAAEKTIKKTLLLIASTIQKEKARLLRANEKDRARQEPDGPRTDRLLLNEERIENIASAIQTIAALPSPTGQLLLERKLENGLKLQKVTVPLGVIGAIYESRPNVTFDIAALSLRSRNACVLKGSRDADDTNREAVAIIQRCLQVNGLPSASVGLLPPEREVLDKMFTATRYIDVIIPRGSAGLIEHVRKNSLVPTIETGAGVCHIYVEKEANLAKAVNIVVNAKTSRPSVCNAVDTVLVDKEVAEDFFKKLVPLFQKHRVEVFAEQEGYALLKGYPFLKKATGKNFGVEYLELKCSVKVVEGFEEAVEHIRKYSTRHSEAIVSEDRKACSRFINTIDAAVVYTNASTRFTDGEEFGLGAEIGISTQKLHARGPFALEKLVTEKWIVQGNGQTRE